MKNWGIVASTLILTCCAAVALGDDAGNEFFEKRVRPILVAKCYSCHSGAKTSGGLSVETREGWSKGGESGPAIAPGKPQESLLIEAINYRSLEMPPRDKGGKLSDEEIAVLTEWVAKGAPDPRESGTTIGGMSRAEAATWWSFQPLPAATGGGPTKIDSFIEAKPSAASIHANGPADKRTLIRRATYDLTGLPPTIEEVEAFLKDESPEAFSRLVDRLLESPQYGVHWGRHWLDVVRYADTAGENTDRPLSHAWRYRNWVFESFQRDMPFDEFVRLQIAGDIVTKDLAQEKRNEGVIATGYLAIARRFGHDIDKDLHLMHEDVIDNLGKNFLGLTIGCARCHDHKYDPITAKDYYALYGIFESTQFAFPGCEAKGQPRDMTPLLSEAQIEERMAPWREKTNERQKEFKRREGLVSKSKLKQLADQHRRVISKGQVNEGASVAISTEAAPVKVQMKSGEALQLIVSPNGNYGADSTLIEWTIDRIGAREGEAKHRWSVADLIGGLTEANPRAIRDQATWCFLDIADGPTFLGTKKESIDGKSDLKAWSNNDTPSVFVNSAAQPIQVWTQLPAQSFFVHPGENRPVAVAWICPEDGEFQITGRVADAHPAGLDGVSFTIEHIANAEYGRDLVLMGRLQATPLPEPGAPPIIPAAYAVKEAKPHNSRLHERGDPEKLGPEIPRAWLEILGGESAASETNSGRAQLAESILRQPLFDRVIVNRIWQWHFGEGIVRSSNDFGSRGEKPTHPELLDFLASEFVASGRSVKAMHRLIMNSEAWKRASATPKSLVENDPENRLLARFGRRRLTAEEIRDSLLMAAGRLEMDSAEAHPFPPEATWGFTQHAPFSAAYETNKRSAFLMVQRQRQHPFLALFDGADPNASTPHRQVTTAPTQALFFLNDPFFHEQAAQVARRVLAHPVEAEREAFLFRLLFQRSPTIEEIQRAKRAIGTFEGSPEERWSGLARVVLASNEFLYVD